MPYKKVGPNKYSRGGKTYTLAQVQAIEASKHGKKKGKKK